MTRLRARCAAALAAWAIGATGALFSAPAHAADGVLWWRAPAAPDVVWRGMLATEGGAVGSGTIIGPYPAFGVAGLLVAVFTHAAISQSVQSSERQRAQEEADKVLAPYAAALRDWPAQELWAAAIAQSASSFSTPTPAADTASPVLKRWDGSAPAPEGPVAETLPQFTLAQDEGVLVLDVAFKLVPVPGAAAVESLVRVVSSPHDAADARAHWSADDARRLKAHAAAMLAHGLQLALRHGGPATTDAPMRTHRYLQGSVERSERSQLLAGDCARVVLRTLRGGLLSVPQRQVEGSTCPQPVAF